MDNPIFFRYDIYDAENDGVLFKIFHLNPAWEKGLFSHVTTNLLSNGYEKEGVIITQNLLDLLNQALNIIRKESKEFTQYDSLFKGEIELPNGEKKEILICENELAQFTIMLPEDY